MSGNAEMARQLLAQKSVFRRLELQTMDNQLDNLRGGAQRSAFSEFQLDLLRDLKRINSHLTSVAYPILEKTGQLRKSRLKKPKKREKPAELTEHQRVEDGSNEGAATT